MDLVEKCEDRFDLARLLGGMEVKNLVPGSRATRGSLH